MRAKKILIVGSSAIWAIENIYAKYLKELGADVTIFDCRQHIDISYWNRGLIRLGVDYPYRKVNSNLIKECNSSKPDIVWVFKGIEIYPSTLAKLKSLGIILVNYNPDHPFIRTFRSSGGKKIPESIPFYDLHFCYSQALCKDINDRYNIPTVWLPFGFNLDNAQYLKCIEDEEVKKVCFVGNPDNKRVKTIENLAKSGLEVDIYGHGWNNFLSKNKLIKCLPGVYGDDFWRVLRKYRVQLNIFRPHNEGSHNMRTFEIPAIGGVMIAPDSEEHRYFFSDHEEVYMYRDEKDLLKLCISTLENKNLEDLRFNARNRSLIDDYSYLRRSKTVYKALKEM